MKTANHPWGAVAFLATLVAMGAVWIVSLLGAMPRTVVTAGITPQSQNLIRQAVPQGWAFFTRDPQTTSILMFTVDNRGAVKLAGTLPQTRLKNKLGLTRNQRSQDTEKAIIASRISKWFECGGMIESECITAAHAAGSQKIQGVSNAGNFCGSYVISLSKTTPFLFRNLSSEARHADQVSYVDVRCEADR